jgi:uncharacterized protein YjiS (DUF1127 family)
MAYLLDLPRARPEQRTGGIFGTLIRVIARTVRDHIHTWMVWRTMDKLNRLDDRTLKDIGIPRGEIEFRVRELMPRDW